MRLKEDKSSWRASGLVVRDARADKTPERPRPRAAKKDTKHWCKGKVGREHRGEWRWAKPYRFLRSWEKACAECDKRLRWTTDWDEVRRDGGAAVLRQGRPTTL